ncbi:MAG: FG-GAP-like repeat-containing protein [candidate division WOR-3 bacterium]
MLSIILVGATYGIWMTWGGDLAHSSLQTMRGAMSSSPTTKWSFLTGDGVETQSAGIADIEGDGITEVIFGSLDGKVYCLSGLTGVKEWEFATGDMVYSSPAIADCDGDGALEILIGSCDDSVYCLSSAGLKEWAFGTGGDVISSPAVADVDKDGSPEVFVGSWGNKFLCLNGPSGTQKWVYPIGVAGVISSPAIADLDGDGKQEVVFTGDGGVVCLDAATGTAKWYYATGWTEGSSPAIADLDGDGKKEVLFGSNNGNVYCISSTGTLRWSFPTGGPISGSSPAIGDCDGDGQLDVVIGSDDSSAYCINASGGLKWQFPMRGQGYHRISLVDADGDTKLEVLATTLSPSGNDTIYCINAENGSLLWKKGFGRDTHSGTPGDIDNDGCVEILTGIWGTHYLYALDDPGNASGCGGPVYEGAEEEVALPGMEFRATGQGIYLYLPNEATISLKFYDAVGKLIGNIYDGLLNAGDHIFVPATSVKGVYTAVLRYPGGTKTVKVVK